MSVRLLLNKSLITIVVAFLVGCKKDKTSAPPSPPPVPEKKYLLTAIRDSADNHEYLTLFEYGSDKKPVRYKTKVDGVLTADSAAFFYNNKKQLIKSIEYSGPAGAVPREIRLYYYNEANRLIGDTAYDASMAKTLFWDHVYSYDGQGRLVRMDGAAAYYKRYEYAGGNNPVKSYQRPIGKPTEALYEEYAQYDDYKSYRGSDSVMSLILLNKAGFVDDFPICSFTNNVIKYYRNPYPPAGVNLRRELTQQVQYNEVGYPTRVAVTISKQFEAGNAETRVFHFEYVVAD